MAIMRNHPFSSGWPPTFRPKPNDLGWESADNCSHHPHPPSPIITITQPKADECQLPIACSVFKQSTYNIHHQQQPTIEVCCKITGLP